LSDAAIIVVLEDTVEGLDEGLSAAQDPDRIILAKNAARTSASGSGSGSFQALTCCRCWTIVGTLIAAARAALVRFRRGRVVTMGILCRGRGGGNLFAVSRNRSAAALRQVEIDLQTYDICDGPVSPQIRLWRHSPALRIDLMLRRTIIIRCATSIFVGAGHLARR
jgi:hypothetical protein